MSRGLASLRLSVLALAACGVASILPAAEPEIRNISVRGLQVGATTTLTIDGDNLGKSPQLLLPFPAKQTLKPGSNDKQATIDVALEKDATPGFFHLRLATEGGVSLPIVIGVDRLPQRTLGASVLAIPVALHGSVAGSAITETTFDGKAGQKIMVEVEAQRIGSKLRPVAHLYSPKRLQVAWSWATPALRGDTRFETTLPEDGTYTITVHDSEYNAAAPSFFRLKLGEWSSVDQVFPPVVGKDVKEVELLGPGTTVRAPLPTSNAASFAIVPWPKEGTWSGPRPFVERSSRTEILEQASSGKPQELPAGAVGVSGRLAVANEEDRYRIPVTPGSKLRFEVLAERIGSPIDVGLVLRNENGTDLIRLEDSPRTLDPILEYTVPDNKMTALIVVVVDSQGRGGPRGTYRLTIDPGAAQSNGFQLETTSQRLTLAASGRGMIPVQIIRNGYLGRIDLSADGLPNGVKLVDAFIPADADGALVTIENPNTGAAATIATLLGKSDNGVVKPVALKGHPLQSLQPWLATELAVAATTNKADEFAVDWRGLANDAALVPGKKLALPISVKRPDPATPVRLTLITSQATILLNNQPDPNRNFRVERAVEFAPKVSDGEVGVLVPGELSSASYDVAVQAEFLTANKQTVIATTVTPVRRMSVRFPIVVKLDGSNQASAKAGATVSFAGTIERSEGFMGDVAVTVTGLPQGVRSEPLTLKAAETKFALKIALPATLAPGELKNLKLSAAVTPAPKAPAARVRSRDVDLIINVLAAK